MGIAQWLSACVERLNLQHPYLSHKQDFSSQKTVVKEIISTTATLVSRLTYSSSVYKLLVMFYLCLGYVCISIFWRMYHTGYCFYQVFILNKKKIFTHFHSRLISFQYLQVAVLVVVILQRNRLNRIHLYRERGVYQSGLWALVQLVHQWLSFNAKFKN